LGVRLQVEAVIKEKMTLQKTTIDRKGGPVRIHIENDAFRDGWLDSWKWHNGEKLYQVKFDNDGHDPVWYREGDLRRVLDVSCHPKRQWVVSALKPVFEYIRQRAHSGRKSSTGHSCDVYKAVQMFNPSFVNTRKSIITAKLVEENCSALAFLDRSDAATGIKDLLSELPAYKHLSTGVIMDQKDVSSFTDSVLQFWQLHRHELPAWSGAARKVLALTPSSAAAERAFSMLKVMFPPERNRSRGDLVETSLMLRYNQAASPLV
jgi:hypothetical protein